jgi:hypothetical protein
VLEADSVLNAPAAGVVPPIAGGVAKFCVANVPNAVPFVDRHVMFGVANVQSPPSVKVDGATPAPPPCINRFAPKSALDAQVEALVK